MNIARLMTIWNVLGISDSLPEIKMSPIVKLALDIILGAVVGTVMGFGFFASPLAIGSCTVAGAVCGCAGHYFFLKFGHLNDNWNS